MFYLAAWALFGQCHLKPVPGAREQARSFADDAVNNPRRRRHVVDKIDRFAGDDRRDLEVAIGARLRITDRFLVLPLQQLSLTAPPLLGEFVAQHASGEGRGPDVAARDIEENASDRLIARRRDNAILRGLKARRFCDA